MPGHGAGPGRPCPRSRLVARGRLLLGGAVIALLLPLPASAARQLAQQPFTFAVISDTHVGRASDRARLKEAIALVNRLRPAPKLLVVAGDLTDGSRPEQIRDYREILATSTVPCFDIPGNHDIGFRPSPAGTARFQRLLDHPPLPRVLTVAGRHFVGFDSMLLNTKRDPPAPDDQGHAHLDALEQLLAGLPPGPIFLVTHIPPVENHVRDAARASWHTPFLLRFREILARFPVAAILAGHFHRDELYFLGDVPLMSLPATGSRYHIVGSVRVITHDARGIRYRQVYFGPKGLGRSYYHDLRDLDMVQHRQELEAASPEELQHLWHRRYTYVPASAATFSPGKRVTTERIRTMLMAEDSPGWRLLQPVAD
ncbi:MAG: metallophosphoesterase [Myxococcota bacterium]|nr:metallophosphoesterase [Myxococcota bacterium]